MRGFAMIAASLAVVAGDDQEGLVVEGRPEELRERRIDGRDLAEVKVIAVLGCEWLRRPVGSVRVVEMNPEEALLPFVFAPPLHGRLEHRGRGTLLNHEVDAGLPFPVVVVVDIESLIETESGIERKCADERGGGIAVLPQKRGHGHML